jgi:hypothetical protein
MQVPDFNCRSVSRDNTGKVSQQFPDAPGSAVDTRREPFRVSWQKIHIQQYFGADVNVLQRDYAAHEVSRQKAKRLW